MSGQNSTGSRHHFQRVRWHSRRGLLELDLVFVPFAEQYFQSLADEDQDAYVTLLTCEDQDLLSWWLQQTQPDDRDLVRILAIIRERHGTATVPPA